MKSNDDQEGSIKIVNFMTLGAGVLVLRRGRVSHIVKMHYFFKYRPVFAGARFKLTKCMVMMTKEGSTKIANFMTPEVRVSCAKVWGNKSYNEKVLFL